MSVKKELNYILALNCSGADLEAFRQRLLPYIHQWRREQMTADQFRLELSYLLEDCAVVAPDIDALFESLAELVAEFRFPPPPVKGFDRLDTIARSNGVPTVSRIFDTRVKTSGDVSELKLYHARHVCVTKEYREIRQRKRDAWLEAAERDMDPEAEQLSVFDRAREFDNALYFRKKDVNAKARKRAHVAVADLMNANDWDYFVTLTFDPEEVNTLDASAVYASLREWTKRIQRKFPSFRFLLCPDYASEAQGIHFHGVIAGVTREQLRLVHARSKRTKRLMYTKKSRLPIYNIESFSYGWTTATEIQDKNRCAGYMTKYITKSTRLMNSYYYCSRGLKRPLVEYFYREKDDVGELVNDYSDNAGYASLGESYALWVKTKEIGKNE